MSAELQECILGFGLFTLKEGWMRAKFGMVNPREPVVSKYREMGESWTIEPPFIAKESARIYVAVPAQHIDQSTLQKEFTSVEDLKVPTFLNIDAKTYALWPLGGNHRRLAYQYRDEVLEKRIEAIQQHVDNVQKKIDASGQINTSEIVNEALKRGRKVLKKMREWVNDGRYWVVIYVDKSKRRID